MRSSGFIVNPLASIIPPIDEEIQLDPIDLPINLPIPGLFNLTGDLNFG
jgi:hypothetical protein